MVARERICLTLDRRHAVPAEYAGAAWLLAGVGCEIEIADARRYGLSEGRLPANWQERLEAPVAASVSPDAPEQLEAAVPKGEVLGEKAQEPAECQALLEAPADKGGLSVAPARRRR